MDDRFWTSSGVTAGIDMAAAFVRHLVGLCHEVDEAKMISNQILGVLEVSYVDD